jgi:DNA-binding NarL/FixJ family response regulator
MPQMEGIRMHGFQIHPVRVFIIAPPVVCWGLERLVQSAHPRLELAGTAPLADLAGASLERTPADVVVVVVESEDELGQLAAMPLSSQAKFLVITGSHDAGLCDKAVLGGARGVVRTWDPPQSLLKAIEKIDEGELWIDRSATSRIFLEMARQKAAEGNDPERTKISTLTRRERQMIAAFASDAAAPAKVIARRLCISEHTLRNHLTSIYSKLDVTNRVDLYAYATRHGLTETSEAR